MISCVDELGLLAVCVLIGDMKGCNVSGRFKFGLISVICAVNLVCPSHCEYAVLFLGITPTGFHIDMDCSKFRFIGDTFVPLEFQFIGLFDIIESSVGDVKNCDCDCA